MAFEISAGAAMTSETPKKANLVDVSLDAALELEEMLQGKRADAPAFSELVSVLKNPQPTYSGRRSINMLADVRSLGVLKDAVGGVPFIRAKDREEAIRFISQYLGELLEAVEQRNSDRIRKAKSFCINLNQNLLAKAYEDLENRYSYRHYPREADVD